MLNIVSLSHSRLLLLFVNWSHPVLFTIHCCTTHCSQDDGRELVYLVGASLKREGGAGRSGEGSSYGIEESLEELGRLSDTAGLKVGRAQPAVR